MLTLHIPCTCAAVHKAYKMLQEEEQKGYVLEIVEDAKAMLDMKVHVYVCVSTCVTCTCSCSMVYWIHACLNGQACWGAMLYHYHNRGYNASEAVSRFSHS